MSARQLIILAVAFVAAIGALFVIRGMNQPRAEPDNAEQIAINGQQVLVMTRDVPQGAALNANDMAWRLFPQESVTDQFVRQANTPDATTQFNGGVTRRAFAAGEPVIAGSIVLPDGRGFLAAQLQPGYRAVSIEIEPQSAAGGYIQPNDHVDILVTTRVRTGSDTGQEQVNTTIVLADVRVLALDDNVQTQTTGDAPTRVTASVAVLELSQHDASLVASAQRQGDISLSLRGVEAETADMRVPSAAPNGAAAQQGSGGAVTIHTFGRTGGRS